MRILVLGGTVFLSRAVAESAARSGHEVVCAARGRSGTVPEGVELVPWDRAEPPPSALTAAKFDAVVDVARIPSWVRSAVAAFSEAHWVFVSTISVYADHGTPGGTPDSLPVLAPATDDVEDDDSDAYGSMKVACEELVRAGAASATVVRPGLIVGPGDPSGRFSYWPRRMKAGGEILAPGSPDDSTQVIDVRDLADWILHCAINRVDGTFDATGPSMPISTLLTETASGVGTTPTWSWLPQDFLQANDVDPWSGPGSIPLWLPRPEYDGMLAHDTTSAIAAGLATRPIAETARDTLAWLQTTPDAYVTGISPAREAELLDVWRHSPWATR
ncbi:NAD-dependent epimerase/dehydratase family protein [Nocardioides sp. KC13]|uniref:NAD-dependent epimerase/dehydratase family protein n=1 Tax=Nocardioides turkmenicus TaxID=2711220 RepID=A0A6M1R6L3_9ACTN|nr:NAD-dependent epimerase/dehydratase family protein [Nocardioides sp. KC13]NGN91977.1 NAD-dependent epimerase/dehydratase family protein [Nocardioides sp. KC13]